MDADDRAERGSWRPHRAPDEAARDVAGPFDVVIVGEASTGRAA